MKKTFTLFLLLLFTVTLFAQAEKTSHYVVNQQDVIEFNIADIDKFDERVYFIYTLSKDERFLLTTSEKDGVFIVNSSNDDADLHEDFDRFCKETIEDFNNMSKDDASEIAKKYKEYLPNEFMNSMMMDIYIKSRQNNLCANADPFCTDAGMYEFPAGVNAGNGETGPAYACLSSTPNPAWYYMRIANPGNINIYMYSTPSRDIDFCCWGPFDDPVAPCPNGLTASKVVSCSYSTSATETCAIPSSAQTGQYYILIITNYSNNTCNITFSKQSGTGTTDCSILPPLISYNDPLCVGGTLILRAETIAGASYSWTGPGGWTSTQQNPQRTNVTMQMAGTYTCQITVGTQQSDPISLDVEIFPDAVANFNVPTPVCAGTPMQFTSTSTTNPTGGTITSWNWSFGDGGTATGANVSHTYSSGGSFTVSLAVATNGECTDTKTQSVTVYPNPNANAGPDQTIGYGGTATLSGSGGQGNFNYHWEPANKVTNPNAQTTTTVALTQNQNFTLTVTSQAGNCVDTDQVTVAISGSAMSANVSAEDLLVCEGGTTTLHASASGGTGNFTYSWSPAAGLSNPNIANPEATITQTTTYTCTISDGATTQSPQVTVQMFPTQNIDVTDEACQEFGGHYTQNGFNISLDEAGEQTQTIYLQTVELGCDSIVTMTLNVLPIRYNDIYDEACQETGSYYAQNGFYIPLDEAGVKTQTITLQTQHLGCDSVLTMNLTVLPIQYKNIYDEACQETGAFYTENGYHIPLDNAGIETQTITLPTQHLGCDSIVTMNLTINPKYSTNVYGSFCEAGTYPFFGQNLNAAGTYEHLLQSVKGCDSLIILTLESKDIYESTMIEESCNEPFHWYSPGKIDTLVEGIVGEEIVCQHKFESAVECDSVVTLRFTRHPEYNDINGSYASVEVFEACPSDNFEWHGYTFNSAGHYTDKSFNYRTIHGCDSIVWLDLTVHPQYTTFGNSYNCVQEYEACENDNFEWHGNYFNAPGHYHYPNNDYHYYYQTVNGCDSIVWLDLTVQGNTSSNMITEFACESFSQDNHTFSSPVDSQEHHQSYVIDNAQGCDSTVNFALTLYPRPHVSNINGENLVSLGGTFSQAKYSYTIDATGTIINDHPELLSFHWHHNNKYNWGFQDSINGDPKEILITVKRPGNDSIYCDVSTPCGDMVRKYIYIYTEGYDVNEVEAYQNITVMPNPTNGDVYIDFNDLNINSKVSVFIYDCQGIRKDAITSSIRDNNKIHYSMNNYPDGFYFIEIITDEFRVVKKVIKSQGK